MTGIIILAAGPSGRLGRPKQNLFFRGETLLHHAVGSALQTRCHTVFVVLGAFRDKIEIADDDRLQVLVNPNWEEGMASSIRMAVQEVERIPEMDRVLMMVCDQPFVTSELLEEMLKTMDDSGKHIVACSYKDAIGVPVLFHRRLFPDLLELKGQEGAKGILMKHPEELTDVPFDLGMIDIDTLSDFEHLRLH